MPWYGNGGYAIPFRCDSGVAACNKDSRPFLSFPMGRNGKAEPRRRKARLARKRFG